jgi:hypothetical protein
MTQRPTTAQPVVGRGILEPEEEPEDSKSNTSSKATWNIEKNEKM